jgi:hypothetical protein
MASAAAPEMVLKRTPSVATSARVLTNTRSCLPSIKRRFRPGRKGLRATYERAVKISARWAAHTQHHFEIHLLQSGQILASLRLPSSSTGPQHHEEVSVPAGVLNKITGLFNDVRLAYVLGVDKGGYHSSLASR